MGMLLGRSSLTSRGWTSRAVFLPSRRFTRIRSSSSAVCPRLRHARRSTPATARGLQHGVVLLRSFLLNAALRSLSDH
eukprot:5231895-Pyramimonas_sp.AAC.1